MMWSVETDATIRAAQAVTGRSDGWFQSGRLGTETTVDHTAALAAVAALHEAGHKAWMSPAPGSGGRTVAVDSLHAYKQARAGIVEAVHAGLEANMFKSEIATRAGLSRPGLDKIIDRHGLAALVKGD